MKRLRLLIIVIVLFAFSCQKEVSNENDFIGLWSEIGNTKVATIEFKSDKTVYFNDTYNTIYKYNYRIDEKLKFMYFSVDDNPEHDSNFAYSYDNKSEELTIWGLYISIPENPSKTIFKKD